MSNQKGSVNIALVVIIVILLGTVGYFAFVKKSEPTQQSNSTVTPSQDINTANTTRTNTKATWKETTYDQFKNLAEWKIDENLSDWRLIDLDRNKLDQYSKGIIFQMSKSFNETGFPGPDVNQQLEKADSDQRALENAVKKVLSDNDWKFVVGPSEGGFYHDYLYVKDNHPLILQIGTRDVVTGGMFDLIEFQY